MQLSAPSNFTKFGTSVQYKYAQRTAPDPGSNLMFLPAIITGRFGT